MGGGGLAALPGGSPGPGPVTIPLNPHIMADVHQTGKLFAVVLCAVFVSLVFYLVITSGRPSVGEERQATEEDAGGTLERPNIILILTDDLDVAAVRDHPESYPNLQALAREGTTFENAFVTNSLCCPSRATILRGQYAHNHQILGNEPPLGGVGKFRMLGREESTVATWLQVAGYETVFLGKYMNGYTGGHVPPPGWDEWYAVAGNYLSTQLDENGQVSEYDPERSYLTDMLSDRAAEYIRRTAEEDPSLFATDQPFFMWLGTNAPHMPATPAARHEAAFSNTELPMPPSFGEDVSDKPAWIRNNPQLGMGQTADLEVIYRNRLRSMLAVDEMVGDLVDTLRESGELDNTYIFFTSDNGFHLGQHRLDSGKWTAYEEDVRVPLLVRGPGVPEGRTLEHLVLNNDLAPTFAALGGTEAPSFADGRSLEPLLIGPSAPPEYWRDAFLIETAAEPVPSSPNINERFLPPLLTGDPLPADWGALEGGPGEDWGRPGLQAVRTRDYLYVEYDDGDRELYDLRQDPYQLDNLYEIADLGLLRQLQARLDALRDCAATECRAAEGAG